MPSHAQLQFQQILDAPDPVVHLQEMIGRVEETDSLEFKLGEPKDAKAPDQDPKRNWSKSLSAFGNTAGGVLVWGIETENRKNQPDIAKLVVPLSNAREFRAMLEACRNNLTDPPLAGVQIRAFPDDGSPGFVVCFVPEGADKPYRASKFHAYYHRNGANSLPITHSMLRAMFYPRVEPRLRPRLENLGYLLGTTTYSFKFKPMVSNVGTGTAVDAAMFVRTQGLGIANNEFNLHRFEHVIHPFEPEVPTPTLEVESPTHRAILISISLYAKDAKPTGYRIIYQPRYGFEAESAYDPTVPEQASVEFVPE